MIASFEVNDIVRDHIERQRTETVLLGRDLYLIHVSSYPNVCTKFYDNAWKRFPSGWFKISRHTQDYFCKTPMTETEATNASNEIWLKLLMYAHELEIDRPQGPGELDFRINVVMSKAFNQHVWRGGNITEATLDMLVDQLKTTNIQEDVGVCVTLEDLESTDVDDKDLNLTLEEQLWLDNEIEKLYELAISNQVERTGFP